MTRNYNTFIYLTLSSFFVTAALFNDGKLYADSTPTISYEQFNEDKQHNVLIEKIKKENAPAEKRKKKRKKRPTIQIDYKDEELVDIINMLAAQKNVNVILPVANPIKSKVTFTIQEKITLDEAWDILYSLLELAGYSMIPQGNMYEIIKTDKNISREPLPLFINTPWEDLPKNEKRIRYVYYFSYIKAGESEIEKVLQTILSDTKQIILNKESNSIIIIDRADNVRSAMEVVNALDQVGFEEIFEYLELRYYPANLIAELFMKELIPSSKDVNRYRLDTQAESDVSYFSRHLRIVPIARTNGIFIIGKAQAVRRVRKFIRQYLDVVADEGKSILHIYQLQYLQAEPFARLLQDFINADKKVGTGQSKTGAAAVEAVERVLGQEGRIIIRSDSPEGAVKDGQLSGGNRLVVAARNEDWIQIRKLIEKLDIPRPQVIIKVLIAELTMDELRAIGSMIRNPAGLPFPPNVDAQSAQFGRVITSATPPVPLPPTVLGPPTTLEADLLRKAFGGTPADPAFSVASTLLPGSSVISFNDRNGATWGLLAVLEQINTRRIVSNPHLITTNNNTAKFEIAEARLVVGGSNNLIGSGAAQVERVFIKAPLILNITPRISSADTVNLSVEVNITRFLTEGLPANPNEGTQPRDVRNLVTNANIYNGGILAIGGLGRTDTSRIIGETPLLARIPIFGRFFENRQDNKISTNLTIIVSPIIIQPRLRGGVSEYTREYVDITKNYARDAEMFDSLRDPITRWFFSTEGQSSLEDIEDFLDKDEFIQEETFGEIEDFGPVNQNSYAPQSPSLPADSQLNTFSNDLENEENENLKLCKADTLKDMLKDQDNPLIESTVVTS